MKSILSKSLILISVFALIFAYTPIIVHGVEDDGNTGRSNVAEREARFEERKQELEQKREERKVEFEERRQELEQKREERKVEFLEEMEERLQERAEKLAERLNEKNDKLADAYLRHLNKMEVVLDKILVRTDKLEAEHELDLSEVRTTGEMVRDNIDAAREEVFLQKEKVYTVVVENKEQLGEAFRTVIQQFKADHGALREELKNARSAIRDFFQELKDAVKATRSTDGDE